MLERLPSLVIVLLSVCSLSAQTNPTPPETEVIERVIRSLIEQQRHDWDDWSNAADRRVVLVANETIPFPALAGDDMRFAVETLKAERNDLYTQLRSASIIELGTWKSEDLPQIKVVSAPELAPTFAGEGLDAAVGLVIRVSTPVFSKDGRTAAVYAEAIGSHVENAHRQLIVLTRKSDRDGEWDAVIDGGRLFSSPKPTAQEREISATDRAAMTAALEWLVTKRGAFDLVGVTDFPPDPAEWRRRQRESKASFEVPEPTLAELFRRNSEVLEFEPSTFSIKGVRKRAPGDKRTGSRPSVLVSLPAYGGDIAILSMTHRTSDDTPRTATYLVVMRRSGARWSVVWTTVREGVIVS